MSEKLKGLTFIPDEETVLNSSRVVFSCKCMWINSSHYPKGAAEYPLKHLEKNPDHEAMIKACDIDNP